MGNQTTSTARNAGGEQRTNVERGEQMMTKKMEANDKQHPESRTIVSGDPEEFDRRVNEAFREGFVVGVNSEAKAAFNEREGVWVHTFYVVMVRAPKSDIVGGVLEEEELPNLGDALRASGHGGTTCPADAASMYG